MELNRVIVQLDAAAEPSRLRLLVALLGGETSVGDLVTVLEQSQPRVSRHLRLLAEAGLVESFREGRSIFYRWSAAGLDAGVASSVAAVAASADPTIVRDRDRLVKLAGQRERDALRRALRSGQGGGLLTADGERLLADVLQPALGEARTADVLHVGCGSGQLIRLLLPQVRTITGTEPSAHRRQLARARLRQAGPPRWTLRDASPVQLPYEAASFDLVILESALATGRDADPSAALDEAVRVLRPAGQLLVLDRVLPTDSELAAHLAARGLLVTRRQWLPGRAPDRALFLAACTPHPAARSGTHD